MESGMATSPIFRGKAFVSALSILALTTAGLMASTASSSAEATGTVTEFAIATANAKPLGMTTGPDGNLWFTETESHKIGKMTTQGDLLAEYDIPGSHPYPVGIVAGADGNLWFADAGESRIGRMTVDGVFTGFMVASSEPAGIAAGPDGNIWFTDFTGATVGKMSTSGTLLSQYPISSPALEVVAGPDGNMWFTEAAINKIAKMTVNGVVLGEYSAPTAASKPAGIIAGTDGNMWFTQEDANQIAVSTPTGAITEYPIPTAASTPSRIIAGSDGNMWFTELAGNQIVRMTIGGRMTEYPIPTASSEPGGTTPGADGNVWFTQSVGNQIGRAAVGPPPPVVSDRQLHRATIAATVYPGGATARSVIQCATNPTFTTGLVQMAASTGSPSTSTRGVHVSGSCTPLGANTQYFARVKSTYTQPAGGSAITNTLYSTTATFRTKAVQFPLRGCVLIPPVAGPRAIKPRGITRLTKPNCVTNAGQHIIVRGHSILRGDIRRPRIFYRNGSWWIATFGAPGRTRLVWSALATNAYAAYSHSASRRI